MAQKDQFLAAEGDRYFARNRQHAVEIDPLLRELEAQDLGSALLEIGCSDGWRLDQLTQNRPGLNGFGIDPSAEAVRTGSRAYPELVLRQGVASDLPFESALFDTVLFGFCLYLCDREDLFRIAAEADRVLSEGGLLGVFDFHSSSAYRKPYAHAAGVCSYKMRHSALFDWNPIYRLERHVVEPHPGSSSQAADDQIEIALFRKQSVDASWPEGAPMEKSS